MELPAHQRERFLLALRLGDEGRQVFDEGVAHEVFDRLIFLGIRIGAHMQAQIGSGVLRSPLRIAEREDEPEQKRKIIGAEFIRVFEEEARKQQGIEFLAQGTIYPDILESGPVKAHHNVGGLPDDLKFELVEPLKFLFKDEVRVVGKALGLPDPMVYRQPFPGPGLGVRCLGAITRDRLEAVRESDAILREEFAKNGLEGKVWQYFTIVPDFKSVGVKDGKRSFEWPVILRAVNTRDAMTATVEDVPFALLQHITARITSEVKGVNRVLYDLTPKPTGTIEWE